MDILSEDGVGRLCSLTNKEMKIKIQTPVSILPITDFLLKSTSIDYLSVLNQNNVIYSINSLDQKLPKVNENHILFYEPKTNYYSSDMVTEQEIPDDGLKNVTNFFSKNCPSTFLNDEFAIEWYTLFFQEIIEEIERNPKKFEDMKGFGCVLNFEHLRNSDVLLKLIETFVSKSIIHDNLIAVKIDGLFNIKMDYTSSIDVFFQLKNIFPADVLFIAAGKILPYEYAFLVNLGFDAIDLSYLLFAGFSGLYFRHEEGMEWIRKLHSTEDFACMCANCDVIRELVIESSNISDVPSISEQAAFHNLYSGILEIERVRVNIRNGTVSTYIERKCRFSLFLLTALRYLQKQYLDEYSSVQTLNKNAFLPCTSPLSYHNPNIVQFKHKLKDNVEPRPNTKICIFLPCSMGKPYSKSKSHRQFRNIIRNTAQKWNRYISEVIITSPLGVVPRELEEVFPAAHYDISVTGDWDAEELDLVSDDITKWIIKLPQDVKIIAYLQGGYGKAFKMAVEKIKSKDLTRVSYYISENLHEFTQSLNKDVESLKDNRESSTIGDILSDEEQSIKMIADFQFGKGAGKKLIGSAARFLHSRNDKIKKIMGYESYGKLQLGRYIRDSGHIQLNYQGGERLADHPSISVVLNTLDISGTTIFKPAIKHVDESLNAGDEVVILGPNKDYQGVGSLIVNCRTFSLMRRGAVVKIRKIKKEKK